MTTIIGIIGMGRLGSSLACSLRQLGLEVRTRTKTDAAPLAQWVAPCQVLCLSVRDDQLVPLAAELGLLNLTGKTILSHSGTVALADLPGVTGKFHPLQSFTSAAPQPIPKGTPWAVEGPVEALVRPWVTAWEGKLYTLTAQNWARYHLAAVFAANFLPLFIRAGADILRPLAVDEADALAWLGPLVQHSTAAGLDGTNPLPYSGPAIRGDADVIARQEAMLQRIAPHLLPLYREATARVGDRGAATRRPDDHP